MTKIVGLRLRGKVIGIEPGMVIGYADREVVGAWEKVELTKRDDGKYTARFVAANRYLTITPDGVWESRVSPGAWEEFYCAEQPPDFALIFLYSAQHPTVAVLTVEVLG